MLDILQQDILLGLTLCVIIIVSISIHELCHVFVAHLQGDDTAIEQGYLTLNPLKLMGIPSLIMLLLVGIAWGAVPVNPQRMRSRKSAMLVSLAGPLSNLILFFVFLVFSYIVNHFFLINNSMSLLNHICRFGANINFVLFLFNLLPIPPLDGFSVVHYFYPSQTKKFLTSSYGQILLVVLCVGIFAGAKYLFIIANYACDFVTKLFAFCI